MRHTFFLFFLLFLLPATSFSQTPNLDQLFKNVVQIETPIGKGSGSIFFRDDEVLILTNRHVVEGYEDFTINVLTDINEPAVPKYNAELVNYSPDYDVALLKLNNDLAGNRVSKSSLICDNPTDTNCFNDLPFEDLSYTAKRGEQIFVLSYPSIGEGELVFSNGIISSIKFNEYDGERIPIWIRTNADIAPGSSGGIAINSNGKVIGMPTYVLTESQTGARLGSALSSQVIFAALDSENVLTTWNTISNSSTNLDYSLEPEYGAITLTAGFIPDPHVVTLFAGGENKVDDLGSDCVGFAASKPDYRLHWSGDSSQLIIYFDADSDADDSTILINSPSEEWYCNDDFDGGTLDPGVYFHNPEDGQYDIWVGSYYEDEFISGELKISESAEPNSTEIISLSWEEDTNFGSNSLSSGFLPDPYTVEMTAGGSVDVSLLSLGDSCVGFATQAPDYRISWTDTSENLKFSFEAHDSGNDTTIIISDPTGNWHCNDDGSGNTLNPLYNFMNPPEGQYDIWIGSYEEGEYIDGVLKVSEL